jgi:predicted Fe-Mo cluster-binding NifX family protein
LKNGKVQNVRIINNPAAVYEHGSGPIAAKALAELRIGLVIASQLGPGALELLEYHKITTMLVDPNITVDESIKKSIITIEQPKPMKQHYKKHQSAFSISQKSSEVQKLNTPNKIFLISNTTYLL